MLDLLAAFAFGFIVMFLLGRENILKEVQGRLDETVEAVAGRLDQLERCHACTHKAPRKKRRPNEDRGEV